MHLTWFQQHGRHLINDSCCYDIMTMKNKKKIKNRRWGEVKEKEAIVATPAGASLLKSSGQLSSAALWFYLTNPSSTHWSCTEHLFCPLVSPSHIQRGLTQPLPVPIAAPLPLLSALSPGRQLPLFSGFSENMIFRLLPTRRFLLTCSMSFLNGAQGTVGWFHCMATVLLGRHMVSYIPLGSLQFLCPRQAIENRNRTI